MSSRKSRRRIARDHAHQKERDADPIADFSRLPILHTSDGQDGEQELHTQANYDLTT